MKYVYKNTEILVESDAPLDSASFSEWKDPEPKSDMPAGKKKAAGPKAKKKE